MAVSLAKWCAYWPESANTEHLPSSETALDVSFLPPMRRRRLSNLTRLSLRLAEECAPEYRGYCVFGSCHGELATTMGILADIINDELISPAAFSTSVHNTAVGMHSINHHNTFPCTSIASGRDTLPACFIEAYGLLSDTEDEVLLVYADDRIDEPLAGFIEGYNKLRGFAALLRKRDRKPILELSQIESQDADKVSEPVLQLASFLNEPATAAELVFSGEQSDWKWKKYE